MSERSHILNAFKPNSEISDPAEFAGRAQQVKDLTDALLSEGSVPIIYGNPGIGKTSLAMQMFRIALGDDQLLVTLNAKDRILPDDGLFVPFWVSCSDETRNKDQVLQRIINTAEGCNSLDELRKDTPTTKSFRTAIRLKIYESETIENYEKAGLKYSKLSLEDQFLAVLKTLAENGIHRTLFIIDELDRVACTKGLSNFIKNTTNKNVRFMLVGIANTISTLLDDHKSIQRILYPAKVVEMKKPELNEIINKAIKLLAEKDIHMSFSRNAKKSLITTAGGFPWFVQVLSKEALLLCWGNGRNVIGDRDVQSAITSLSSERFSQQYADTYQMAVKNSKNREILLRLMAKWEGDNVYLSEIYPLAKELGVKNPYSPKNQLIDKHYGEVIVNPPNHGKEVIRFRDNMFKRYVDIRGSIYEDVKEQVDNAWKEYSET